MGSTHPSGTRVGPLTVEHLDRAVALSTSVGWNQTEDDWRRILELYPDGAFGAFDDDRLVGSATVVRYPPDVAWIGMVIVDPVMQGKRIGSAVLDAALMHASVPSGTIVGLDATDAGRPLYLRRDFVAVTPIERWGGRLTGTQADPTCRVTPLDPSRLDDVVAFDRSRIDVDRSRALRRLIGDRGVRAWRVDRDHGPVGYGVLRPGRTRAHMGPLVADDHGALRSLMNAAMQAKPDSELFLDAVTDAPKRAEFEAAGLQVARRLTRMTRTRPVPALVRQSVWAAMGLEWG